MRRPGSSTGSQLCARCASRSLPPCLRIQQQVWHCTVVTTEYGRSVQARSRGSTAVALLACRQSGIVALRTGNLALQNNPPGATSRQYALPCPSVPSPPPPPSGLCLLIGTGCRITGSAPGPCQLPQGRSWLCVGRTRSAHAVTPLRQRGCVIYVVFLACVTVGASVWF